MTTDKLTITLTLTPDEAELLIKTLDKGAISWYGAGLQTEAHRIKKYIAKRIDAALERLSTKRKIDRYLAEVARVSLTSDDLTPEAITRIRANNYGESEQK